MTHDSAPLLATPYVVQRTSAWRVWSPRSPGHRFYLLLATCGVAFSGHFIRSGMAAVEQLMLDDPEYPITNTFYGAINSVASLPNLVLPFVGGHLLDRAGSQCLLYFLGLMLMGQTLFAVAMGQHCLWLALVGRFVFGMGEGSVYVGARTFAAHWFDTTEITCAMGTIVATTNIARMLAKVTMAPVALHFGSYVYAFWYGNVMVVVSFAFAAVVVRATHRLKELKATHQHAVRAGAPVDPSLRWLAKYIAHDNSSLSTPTKKHGVLSWTTLQLVGTLPGLFWLVLALQILYVQNLHWFQNVSASYLYQVWGYTIVMSGVLASLSHALVLFSPFLGLVLDRTGGRLLYVVASTVCAVAAFAWLLFTPYTPIVALLLISLCLTVTPAVLVATIAITVPRAHYGMAFGVLEVLEALATTCGNLLVGYLRDVTGSFTADIYFFFGVAWITVGLSVALVSISNQPRTPVGLACDDERCIELGHSASSSSTNVEN
ncbi:Major Facilitator Superfamily (MFS) [Achlya hypogyna]|uniref:Lysosomal dipeptide transporter MFSD1 n=1 Tax=Achlya hypogyna TaxID=1202772 RepID=A0A1V9Z895_ACHHY|nr:Major Facilitator Superfamily (MFS) [Achlya hypogyna]